MFINDMGLLFRNELKDRTQIEENKRKLAT